MNTKKVLLVLLVAFLGFWMFTDPAGLADAGQALGSDVWAGLTQLFEAVIDFFGAL